MHLLPVYISGTYAAADSRCIIILQSEKVVKLLVQLKLHSSIRNNFDYFEVHIPYFNRYVCLHIPC